MAKTAKQQVLRALPGAYTKAGKTRCGQRRVRVVFKTTIVASARTPQQAWKNALTIVKAHNTIKKIGGMS